MLKTSTHLDPVLLLTLLGAVVEQAAVAAGQQSWLVLQLQISLKYLSISQTNNCQQFAVGAGQQSWLVLHLQISMKYFMAPSYLQISQTNWQQLARVFIQLQQPCIELKNNENMSWISLTCFHSYTSQLAQRIGVSWRSSSARFSNWQQNYSLFATKSFGWSYLFVLLILCVWALFKSLPRVIVTLRLCHLLRSEISCRSLSKLKPQTN